MKNIIFLSPNFPTNYWLFCRELKKNGMNVLGIGDQPYEDLNQNLRDNLNEYYKVSNLENWDEVFRAVAFLTFKYGKIDWLESNNEYWIERDARLRTEFNITTGFNVNDIPRIKYKSQMKAFYEKAGIPVARYHMVSDIEGCREFIELVGYPVVAKPDNGVGASSTFKISCDEDLVQFFADKIDGVEYIMEEFVRGEVNSYDAIIDADGNPIFETGNVTPMSIMDIVNNNDDSIFYILKELPADTRTAGRATVKSFNVRSRFVHFEFFRLLEDQEGLGKKGEIVGLEVNMRPSGGCTPDMINFAHNTDVYKIWADMVAYGSSLMVAKNSKFCGFCGRRNGKNYKMSHDQIIAKYSGKLKMQEPIPEVLSGAMGNYLYIGVFETKKELDEYYTDMLACN